MTRWVLRHANGETIGGEFTWVDGGDGPDPDFAGWWDDIDGEQVVVAERMQVVETRRYEIRPNVSLCPECHGEGICEVTGDDRDDRCGFCLGDGSDPRERVERVGIPLIDNPAMVALIEGDN